MAWTTLYLDYLIYRGSIVQFFLLYTRYDSATLVLVVQAAIGPRKGLNLPAGLSSIAFFLSEIRGQPTNF